MKIIKNNHFGEKVWEYDGELIERSRSAYLFKAVFNRANLLFNGVLLKEGDIFQELYPIGKWFNIYQIYDRDDNQIKGWYCNVTRPARIVGRTISYDDLALDLLVYPDRKLLVLDEDEFETLALSDGERNHAMNGMGELKRIFSCSEPFKMENYKRFI